MPHDHDGFTAKVWLVGAGPGAADLLTVRAARAIGQAQALLYDALVDDEVLAQLDVHRLRLEMESTAQEKLRYLADADRVRALGDEAGAQVSLLEVKVLDQQEKKFQADIDSATLRSPLDGVVMTKDLELRAGEVLQQGAPFVEIDSLDGWQLHAEINERDISYVEQALKDKGSLDLTYILYSQSTYVLHARLDSRQQISAQAYPRDKDNVFIVTIDNPSIAPEILKDIRPGLTGRAKLELGRRPVFSSILSKLYRWFQFRMIS